MADDVARVSVSLRKETNKMEWLTIEQIEAAARESLLAAVVCSRLHWHQLATAPLEELTLAFQVHKVALDKDHCALCTRFEETSDVGEEFACFADATTCPLWGGEGYGCCDVYRIADCRWQAFYRSPGKETCDEFQVAARKVEERLAEIERKVRSEEEEASTL